MGPLKRIRETFLVRKILRTKEPAPSALPVASVADELPDEEPAASAAPERPADPPPDEPGDFVAPDGTHEPLDPDAPEHEAVADGNGLRSGLTGWVERRAQSVVSKIYDSHADDLETRARRAVSSAYSDQADDLEDRAVRAMRRAITTEADRIKDVIEHSVQVKKREVRLSLLVLVTASLVYLALYWFTSRPSS